MTNLLSISLSGSMDHASCYRQHHILAYFVSISNAFSVRVRYAVRFSLITIQIERVVDTRALQIDSTTCARWNGILHDSSLHQPFERTHIPGASPGKPRFCYIHSMKLAADPIIKPIAASLAQMFTCTMISRLQLNLRSKAHGSRSQCSLPDPGIRLPMFEPVNRTTEGFFGTHFLSGDVQCSSKEPSNEEPDLHISGPSTSPVAICDSQHG